MIRFSARGGTYLLLVAQGRALIEEVGLVSEGLLISFLTKICEREKAFK